MDIKLSSDAAGAATACAARGVAQFDRRNLTAVQMLAPGNREKLI
jgi:hypothetical protein